MHSSETIPLGDFVNVRLEDERVTNTVMNRGLRMTTTSQNNTEGKPSDLVSSDKSDKISVDIMKSISETKTASISKEYIKEGIF